MFVLGLEGYYSKKGTQLWIGLGVGQEGGEALVSSEREGEFKKETGERGGEAAGGAAPVGQ